MNNEARAVFERRSPRTGPCGCRPIGSHFVLRVHGPAWCGAREVAAENPGARATVGAAAAAASSKVRRCPPCLHSMSSSPCPAPLGGCARSPRRPVGRSLAQRPPCRRMLFSPSWGLHPLAADAATHPPPPAAAVPPSLLDVCVEAVAAAAGTGRLRWGDQTPCAAELLQRVLASYSRIAAARRVRGTHNEWVHLAALRELATCWQPCALALRIPHLTGEPLAELAALPSLEHLELLSCGATASLALRGLTALRCLSLRGCTFLQPPALHHALTQLPQLEALDLSGLPAASDGLTPAIMWLQELTVLRLDRTACGDATVDLLTYGQRWHRWQQSSAAAARRRSGGAPAQPHTAALAGGQPTMGEGGGSEPALQNHWPRTRIRRWHLAHTRVTPRAAELLVCLEDLIFLDLRGSGVTASQLVPLRERFGLQAPQGAVLSRSAALAAAALQDVFVCAAPERHSAAAAAAAAAPTPQDGRGPADAAWVRAGVEALLAASGELQLSAQRWRQQQVGRPPP